MGFIDRLFGGGKKKPGRAHDGDSHGHSVHGPSSAVSSYGSSIGPGGNDARQRFKVRRDLLRVVLRDVLTRSGIPVSWIEIHPLAATSSAKQAGVHARFLVKHWSPLVMTHTPGIERLFVQRLLALDPLATDWVQGLSWQLQLPADAEVAALPRPGMWTAAAPRAQPLRAADLAPHDADVIAGPVHIGATGATHDAKADLDRLLAEGDAARDHGSASFDTTQPSPLR